MTEESSKPAGEIKERLKRFGGKSNILPNAWRGDSHVSLKFLPTSGSNSNVSNPLVIFQQNHFGNVPCNSFANQIIFRRCLYHYPLDLDLHKVKQPNVSIILHKNKYYVELFVTITHKYINHSGICYHFELRIELYTILIWKPYCL